MSVPTVLEADVLLLARDDFRSRRQIRSAMVPMDATAEQVADAERRYCEAALKNAKARPDWPKGK